MCPHILTAPLKLNTWLGVFLVRGPGIGASPASFDGPQLLCTPSGQPWTPVTTRWHWGQTRGQSPKLAGRWTLLPCPQHTLDFGQQDPGRAGRGLRPRKPQCGAPASVVVPVTRTPLGPQPPFPSSLLSQFTSARRSPPHHQAPGPPPQASVSPQAKHSPQGAWGTANAGRHVTPWGHQGLGQLAWVEGYGVGGLPYGKVEGSGPVPLHDLAPSQQQSGPWRRSHPSPFPCEPASFKKTRPS